MSISILSTINSIPILIYLFSIFQIIVVLQHISAPPAKRDRRNRSGQQNRNGRGNSRPQTTGQQHIYRAAQNTQRPYVPRPQPPSTPPYIQRTEQIGQGNGQTNTSKLIHERDALQREIVASDAASQQLKLRDIEYEMKMGRIQYIDRQLGRSTDGII